MDNRNERRKESAAKAAADKAYEDMISNKILLNIFLGFVGLMILMFFYRNFGTNAAKVAAAVCKWLTVGFAVISVGCLVWWFVTRKEAAIYKAACRAITPGACLKAALMFTGGMLLVWWKETAAVKLLFVLIPLYVALYFIGKVFQKDCVLMCDVGAFGALCLYVLRNMVLAPKTDASFIIVGNYAFFSSQVAVVALVVLAVLTVAGVVLLVRAQKNRGVLKLGKREFDFGKKANFYFTYVAAAIPWVAVVATYAMQNKTIMKYGVFACGGYLLLGLLFYTYRMMTASR